VKHEFDGFAELRQAREDKDNRSLRLEAGTKKKRAESRRQKIAEYKEDLIEEASPSEIDLKRMRAEGLVYLMVTFAICVGMFYLVRLSLQSFLPGTHISHIVQGSLAFVFTLGTVTTIHLSFALGEDGVPVIPAKFKAFAAASFVIGLISFSLVRSQLVGVTATDLASVKSAEYYAKVLGAFAFIALGIGLDIGGGITGAISWNKLSRSIPLLRIHGCIRGLSDEADLLDERVAAIESLWPKTPVPISGKPHSLDTARTAPVDKVADGG
jgi:hypothetical protein